MELQLSLEQLAELSLVFRADGSVESAPEDPRSVFGGVAIAPVQLARRTMLVTETPDFSRPNAVATHFAGRPVFGDVVVLGTQCEVVGDRVIPQ